MRHGNQLYHELFTTRTTIKKIPQESYKSGTPPFFNQMASQRLKTKITKTDFFSMTYIDKTKNKKTQKTIYFKNQGIKHICY